MKNLLLLISMCLVSCSSNDVKPKDVELSTSPAKASFRSADSEWPTTQRRLMFRRDTSSRRRIY